MLRLALIAAGLTFAAGVSLAVPAAADGFAEPDAPAGFGGSPAGYAAPGSDRPAPRMVRRTHRIALRRGVAVRPVSYGEPAGPAFHAWLPRNTNLPIYNVPPPFFPED
ncbi:MULTISPECIES: hypothetical protein [Methylobacterium]|jgi:hypothetical protein|uniref:hypothetical protein n=1 Tax=Methylobacterium TaxID=407 RepID=UPI0008ED56B8|nr:MULTISPECIES: hypothetical protein [Methylobacterium]MBK3396503.1 hypothetical protein [Methylobacterium ajmalii]MBK3411010.1 hypothetical protein [Methylobacterium ajmalii]MBK3422351.1 hypothetical protein [Methylobacterium ajmalii]MBZ6416857.1 hypothetical protein [Methylobacterium sp.]SFE80372.1 hypothetical protein SAMN04487844_10643 [Methylobacterium sp. yr596]